MYNRNIQFTSLACMNEVDALVTVLQLTFAAVGQRVASMVGVGAIVHAERRVSQSLLHNNTDRNSN